MKANMTGKIFPIIAIWGLAWPVWRDWVCLNCR